MAVIRDWHDDHREAIALQEIDKVEVRVLSDPIMIFKAYSFYFLECGRTGVKKNIIFRALTVHLEQVAGLNVGRLKNFVKGGRLNDGVIFSHLIVIHRGTI